MSEEQAAITQQATAPTPKTRAKNPKRVAAGKAIAEKTRQAREAQKKTLAKAAAIIANDEAKKKDRPEPAPEPAIPEPVNADQPQGSFYWGFSTTQWLMVGGILVSLLGLYYKREEIKAAHAATVGKPAPTLSTTVDTPAPNVGTTVDTTAPKARRALLMSQMD